MGMFDFTDRVAVITGSTAGLGKGMAIAWQDKTAISL